MDPVDSQPDDLAIAEEAVARGWMTVAALDAAIAAVANGQHPGPLGAALVARRALAAEQWELLRLRQVAGTRFGDFLVQQRLGSGAMGEVYLARREGDDRPVALKVMSRRYADDEAFIKRFARECEALMRLDHPHVARAIAHGLQDGRHYLALEYINGPNLAQLLERHGPLPERWLLRIAIEVAEGLEHVHATTGIVHRDVKPENILAHRAEGAPAGSLDDHDQAKLIDFGLARAFATDERLTITGITMGTPHYMSPEQIRGSQNLDHRSDIYGLAATLVHLLTGAPPYPGTAPATVMTAHLTEAVPDPAKRRPDLSPVTRDLLMMAMAKEPDRRYLTWRAFIAAAKAALRGSSRLQPVPQLMRVRTPLPGSSRPPPAAAPVRRPSTDGEAPDAVIEAGDAAGALQPAKPAGPTDYDLPEVRPPAATRVSERLLAEPPATGLGVLPWVMLALAALAALAYLFAR